MLPLLRTALRHGERIHSALPGFMVHLEKKTLAQQALEAGSQVFAAQCRECSFGRHIVLLRFDPARAAADLSLRDAVCAGINSFRGTFAAVKTPPGRAVALRLSLPVSFTLSIRFRKRADGYRRLRLRAKEGIPSRSENDDGCETVYGLHVRHHVRILHARRSTVPAMHNSR